MLAAIQNGIRTIEMRDIPAPVADGESAIVRVHTVGVCGSDLHLYHERAEPQSLPIGHELAGEVIALPNGYEGSIRLGDLVAVDTVCNGMACGNCPACLAGHPFHCPARQQPARWGGAFAEQIQRRVAGLFVLPAGVTPEQGAMVEPLAVGVHGIRWSRMQPGASIVVIGAGTIGLTSVVAARAMGAGDIHVLARYDHQAELATVLGATSVSTGSTDEAIRQVREQTGGVGADLVIETVGGHGDTLNLTWDLVRPRGTVAVLGVFPDRVPIDLRKPLLGEVWVTFPICYGVQDGKHDFEVAIDMIAQGKAPVEKLVTHRLPLSQTPEGFRVAADKSTGSVKVHLRAG